MYDHCRDLVGLFFGRLHYLSRPGRRKIFGIYRLDRRYLLPDTGFARSARFGDVAPGDLDAYTGFSEAMGPAQAHRTLDDSDLAVRLDYRSRCLFDALQMVPSGNVTQTKCLRHDPSLALGNYLMFDHTMRSCACWKNYGDYRDV